MSEFTADQLKKLPAEAKVKAFALMDAFQADLGSRRQADRRLSELHAELGDVEDARAKQIARAGGRRLSDDLEAHYDAKRSALKSQIARFNAAVPMLNARYESLSQHIERCGEAVVEARKIVAIKPHKSPRPIEEVRADLSQLLERRETILYAPLPREEYLATLRQALDAEAEAGRVTFDARIRDRDPFGLLNVLRPDGSAPQIGPGAFLLWLFRDEVFALLADMVPQDGRDTLTDAARSARIDEIDAEILNLEREEEAAIDLADRDGRRIDRRPEASPLAILGIAVEV